MAASSNTIPHLKVIPPDSRDSLHQTSSSLSKVLASQESARAASREFFELRRTLKEAVVDQFSSSLKGIAQPQIDQLIKKSNAALDKSIEYRILTSKPNELTNDITKDLLTTTRAQLRSYQLSSTEARNKLQRELDESLANNLKAKRSAENNRLLQSFENASIKSYTGKPTLIPHLKNMIPEADDAKLAAIEADFDSELMTQPTLDQEAAKEVVGRVLTNNHIDASLDTKEQLSSAVSTNSILIKANPDAAFVQSQLIDYKVGAPGLTERLAAANMSSSDLLDDSYSSSPSSPSIQLDFDTIKHIDRLLKNPNDTQAIRELIGMPSKFSPNDLVLKWQDLWRPQFSPTISTEASQSFSFIPEGFGQEAGSILQNAGSQAQIGTHNFLDSVRSFFGNLGGEGSSGLGNFLRSGASTAGSGLKSAGRALGTGAKALGKSILAGAKALGSKLAAALAAAGTGIITAIAFTAVAAVVIIGLIVLLQWLTNGSYKKSSSNLTPVGGVGGPAGSGGGYCNPSLTPETCTPLFCEGSCLCPAIGTITQGPGGGYSHVGFNALDIGIENGDPIFSISNGTVTFADFSTVGYGNLVIVSNPDGTQLYYAHLDTYFVQVGQQVVSGEQIGIGDNTGNSTGPHLHIEYKGPGAQNILNLFDFSENEKVVLEGCSNQTEGSPSCGGISCQK